MPFAATSVASNFIHVDKWIGFSGPSEEALTFSACFGALRESEFAAIFMSFERQVSDLLDWEEFDAGVTEVVAV